MKNQKIHKSTYRPQKMIEIETNPPNGSTNPNDSVFGTINPPTQKLENAIESELCLFSSDRSQFVSDY